MLNQSVSDKVLQKCCYKEIYIFSHGFQAYKIRKKDVIVKKFGWK